MHTEDIKKHCLRFQNIDDVNPRRTSLLYLKRSCKILAKDAYLTRSQDIFINIFINIDAYLIGSGRKQGGG